MSNAPLLGPCTGLASLVLAAIAPAQSSYVERAAELGLVHRCGSGFDLYGSAKPISDWIQSGMAPGDLDGDGDLDLVAAGGMYPSHVLRNDGAIFTDITAWSGIETGELARAPALGDYDRDGDLDLYLAVLRGGSSAVPRGRLFRNQGDGRFEDVSSLSGALGGGRSVHAQWFDLDFDGLLDLYLSEFQVSPNLFYRNNGDGSFSEVGASLGLGYGGSTHISGICDIDGDRLPDVFVGNDYVVSYAVGAGPLQNLPDAQLQGQSNGSWLNVNAGSNYDLKQGIMGLAFGDVDYDGDFDIYRTDVDHSWLSINHGWPSSGLAWTHEEVAYGVDNDLMPWLTMPGQGRAIGWATAFLDTDFDRWLDLYVVNGEVAGLSETNSYSPYNQKNRLYVGKGPSAGFSFSEKTSAYGLFEQIDDRGASITDFDQDGDLDIFVSPTNGNLRYYENRIEKSTRGYLAVVPATTTSAPGGAGTLVSNTDLAGWPHLRWVGGDGMTASQNENLAYFGLGEDPDADVQVLFQSGITLDYTDVPKDTRLVALEPELIRVWPRVLPINSLTAGGQNTFEITVFAHDQSGQPLLSGANVVLDVPGLTPATALIYEGGNEYRQEFRVSNVQGSFRVQLSIDGWSPAVKPRLFCRGALSASKSSVRLIPEALRAGSGDSFEVLVSPKDSQGLAVGPGHAVSVSFPSIVALGPTEDLGDGRYRVRFPAPANPGSAAPVVKVDGVDLTGEPKLEAAGAADPVQSTVSFEVCLPYQAANPSLMRFAVRPCDSAGRRLGPRAQVDVVLPGQLPLVERRRPALVPTGPAASAFGSQGNLAPLAPPPAAVPEVALLRVREGSPAGDFLFGIDKGSVDPLFLPSGTIELWVDGQFLKTVPFDFAP